MLQLKTSETIYLSVALLLLLLLLILFCFNVTGVPKLRNESYCVCLELVFLIRKEKWHCIYPVIFIFLKAKP